MANSRLGHHGNGHGLHDLLDHLGVGHSRDATLRTDVSGDTLKRHNGDSTSLLSDSGLENQLLEMYGTRQKERNEKKERREKFFPPRKKSCEIMTYLLSIDNVHDDSSLEHSCQTGLDEELR